MVRFRRRLATCVVVVVAGEGLSHPHKEIATPALIQEEKTLKSKKEDTKKKVSRFPSTNLPLVSDLLAPASDTIEKLQAQIKTLSLKLNSIQADEEEQTSKQKIDYESKLEVIKSEEERIEGENEDLKTKISLLQKDISDREGRCHSISGEIKRLRGVLSGLKSRIGEKIESIGEDSSSNNSVDSNGAGKKPLVKFENGKMVFGKGKKSNSEEEVAVEDQKVPEETEDETVSETADDTRTDETIEKTDETIEKTDETIANTDDAKTEDSIRVPLSFLAMKAATSVVAKTATQISATNQKQVQDIFSLLHKEITDLSDEEKASLEKLTAAFEEKKKAAETEQDILLKTQSKLLRKQMVLKNRESELQAQETLLLKKKEELDKSLMDLGGYLREIAGVALSKGGKAF